MSRCAPRPGFNLDLTFRYHVGKVRNVVPMGHRDCFISYDATTLKVWQQSTIDPHKFDILCDMSMPHNQYNFVSTLCFNPNSNHIMVACADNSLKVFTDKLRLRCSLPWVNSSIATMVYNPVTDGIITSGAAGVKLWHSNPDQTGYKRAKAANEPMERPLIVAGRPVPWCYGSFERITNKLTYQVPGLIPRGKTLAPDVQDEFCEHLQLLVEQQTLVVMFRVDVFVYQASDGTLLFSWRGLSHAPLSAAVYLPQQQMLITASTDPQLAAWKVDPGRNLELQRHFGRSPAGFHSIAVSPKRNWVMSSSLDGLVIVWDIETFTATFTMKCTTPLFGLKFYQEDRFLCRHGDRVKLFNILQLFETWVTTTAAVVSLRPLSFGLLLATFADSSVRVLDACSTYGYSHSVVSTPPQLSTSDLVGAAVGLTAGRLYALLGNGHVHVWELHLQRPPTFQEAWTHLAKEQGSSIAFLDGALVPRGVASHLGLSVSPDTGVPEPHLVIGTRSGEVVVVDAVRHGLLLLRLPLFRVDPVSHVLLDLDRLLLVAGAASGVRVVDLAAASVVSEVDTEHTSLTSLDLMNGTALLGYSSGTVKLLDLTKGLVGRPGSSQGEEGCSEQRGHTSRVVSVAASHYLQHFVTCSVDGTVKVWDQHQRLAAALDLSRPLSAACFLNDQGDLLIGWDRHLLVVRSSAYALVPLGAPGANSSTPSNSLACTLDGGGGGKAACSTSTAAGQGAGQKTGTLFDRVAGQTVLPRALLRNMTSQLQDWCTTPVPKLRLPTDWSALAAAESTPRSQRALVDLERSRVRASLLRGNAGERQVLRQNTLTAAVLGQTGGQTSGSQLLWEEASSRPGKRSVIEAAAAATMAYVADAPATPAAAAAAGGIPSRSSSPAPGGPQVKDSLSAAASLASIHDQLHKPVLPAKQHQDQQLAAVPGDLANQDTDTPAAAAAAAAPVPVSSCSTGGYSNPVLTQQNQQQEQQQQVLPACRTASQPEIVRRSVAGLSAAGAAATPPDGSGMPPSTATAAAAEQREWTEAGAGGGGMQAKKSKGQYRGVTFAGADDGSTSTAAAAGGSCGGAAVGSVRGSAAGRAVSTAGCSSSLATSSGGAVAAAAAMEDASRQSAGGRSTTGGLGQHSAGGAASSPAAALGIDVDGGDGAEEAAAAAGEGNHLYIDATYGQGTAAADAEAAAGAAEAAAVEVVSQLATLRGTSAAQRRLAMAQLEGISDPGMLISGLKAAEEDPETWRTWYACNVQDIQRQAWAASLKRTLGLEASIQSLMAQQLKQQQEKARSTRRATRSTGGQRARSPKGARSAASSCRTTAEYEAQPTAAAAAAGGPQVGSSDGTACGSSSSGSGSVEGPGSTQDTASSSAGPGVDRVSRSTVGELPELQPGSGGGAVRRTASIAGAGPDEVYHIGQLQVTVSGAWHRRTSLCSVALDEEVAATAAAGSARRSTIGAARASVAGGTVPSGQPMGQTCTLPSIRPASRDAAGASEAHDQQCRGSTGTGTTQAPQATATTGKPQGVVPQGSQFTPGVQQERKHGSNTCTADLLPSSSSGGQSLRTTCRRPGAGSGTLTATAATTGGGSSMYSTGSMGSRTAAGGMTLTSSTATAAEQAAAAAAAAAAAVEDAVLRDTSTAKLDGLPVLMRKIAPVVSHPNAFLDDCTPPPEIAAIIRQHHQAAEKAKEKGCKVKKTSKKARRKAQGDLTATAGGEQGGTLHAGAMTGTVAALTAMAEGAAAAGRGRRSAAAEAPTISWGGAGFTQQPEAEASSLSQRILGAGALSQQASTPALGGAAAPGCEAAAGSSLLASSSAASLRQVGFTPAPQAAAAAVGAERSAHSLHGSSSTMQIPLVDLVELADAVAGVTQPWLGPQASAAFSSTSHLAPKQPKSKQQQVKVKKSKKTKRGPLVPHWQLATAASNQRAQEVQAATAERTGQPLQRLQGELTMASSFWHSSSNMLAGSGSSSSSKFRGSKKGGKKQPELSGDQVAAALTASEFERLLRAARRRQDLAAPIASDVRLGLKELEVHEARQEAAAKQWLPP